VLRLREDQSTEGLNRALLAGWQAPDLLGIGVIVCDASSRLLIANKTALDILRLQDGLLLSSDGRLCGSEEGAQLVTDIVRRCANEIPTTEKHSNGCFSLKVRTTSGKTPITLLARPFRPPASEGTTSMALVLLLNSSLAGERDDGLAPLLRLLGLDPLNKQMYGESLQ